MPRNAVPTPYDTVAYPSAAFGVTHPDRLATIARLHGLQPPAIETARILEVGGGTGINVIAMAVAFPEAHFLSFDLAEAPIARGRAIADAAALGNVRIEVGDILDAAVKLEGPFDYIIVHGVYAWVPAPIRAAIMTLIGRVLSPNGVAFVSYNALPGGYMRNIIREMALLKTADIPDPIDQTAAARAYLLDYAEPRANDRHVVQAMRAVATPISHKPIEVLHHDELGAVFAPQSLTQVVAAAAEQGLLFLNEAEPDALKDGLPDDGSDTATAVRAAQLRDYETIAFFRQTLFVRADQHPARRPVVASIRDLYVSAHCERTESRSFRNKKGTFGMSDDALADAIGLLSERWPNRLPAHALVDSDERLLALYHLFAAGAIELHSSPLPAVTEPGPRPRTSRLLRAQITAGEEALYTLDHRVISLDTPGPRAFLMLLDGTRDRAALERDWQASGFAAEIDAASALHRFASEALLLG